MKKLVLLLLAICLVNCVRAYDYPYLTFQTSDGSRMSLSATSLVMSVGEGNLIVTNSDLSQIFVLSNLTKMYFSTSAETTGVNSVENEVGGEVEVFTLSGLSVGRFSGMKDAQMHLPRGIYVVKSSQGVHKIAVK